MNSELYHYGTPQPFAGSPNGSGRYRLGSGDDSEYKGSKEFLDTVQKLKDAGMTSQKDIANAMGMNTSEWRAKNSISKDQVRQYRISKGQALVDSGMSVNAAAKELGIGESSLRNLLTDNSKQRSQATNNVAEVLRDSISKKQYIDVGKGVESYLGVSRSRLNTAVKKLRSEGYNYYYIDTEQLGTGNKTSLKVLAAPDIPWKTVNANKHDISLPFDHYTEDGGRTFLGIEKPTSISSDRIKICYAEDGGIKKDGVIELRRNVEDLSLGGSNYAQVRIAVDGTHYLKGMAIYRDDMPRGVDVIFNTNKHKDKTKLECLKPLKTIKDPDTGKEIVDPDNPFGATIRRQMHYTDQNGKKQLSAVNIVNDEGTWNTWSKTLSSQFLSKQNLSLIKQQLSKSFMDRKSEYEEISSLTNPTVKRHLLEEFASNCDAAAVHLKAAGLPRQRSQVILPVSTLKDNQCYCNNFRTGETVALIRYPHGGTFEIPILTVNNRHKDAKSILGSAQDAIGINERVAERLSGADFDGDTVVVIPIDNQNIKSTNPLKGLEGFDPKERYPYYEGMKVISARNKQKQMGVVSNLITDMTIKGAEPDEIAAAVRHSMVVIDAEKHKLDWQRSYKENNISALKAKYQNGRGASTLISKASAQLRVPKRKELTSTRDMTPSELAAWNRGEKVYRETGETYEKKDVITDPSKMTKEELAIYNSGRKVYRGTGKIIESTQMSTPMAEAKDARSLSSGHPKENLYADYANRLKDMANQARKQARNAKDIPYSSAARETYKAEYESLKAKLDLSIRNKPLERQAQLLAQYTVRCKQNDNPDMDADELKKVKNQALAEARLRVGASKYNVEPSSREWEAIQSGAISGSMLKEILNNSDSDKIKQLATPRKEMLMTSSKVSRAKAMLANGSTVAEVADRLGVSISTINRALY